MPRPRFQKLPPEKRARILEAAAQEFAAHGYEAASLNQILERAEISKGAVYYYFDDKADIFATVVHHALQELLGQFDASLPTLTADTFWPTIERLYRQQFVTYQEHPWMLGVLKAAGKLSPEALTAPPLQSFVTQVQRWLSLMLHQGRALGLVRTDLPNELLIGFVIAIDNASDRWLLQHWHTLPPPERDTIITAALDILKRIMSPPHDLSPGVARLGPDDTYHQVPTTQPP